MQLPPQRAMLRPKCWGSKGADGRAFLDDLPVQLLFRLLHSPSRFSAHRNWKRKQKRVKSSISFLVIFMPRLVPKRPSGGMQPCHQVSGFTIATRYTVRTAPIETRHQSAKMATAELVHCKRCAFARPSAKYSRRPDGPHHRDPRYTR